MKILFIALLLTYCLGCTSSPENSAVDINTPAVASDSLPVLLQQALEAHGGLSQWQKQQQLSYELYQEETLVDQQLIALKSRKVLLRNDTYRIGYDGTSHWVSPDTTAFDGDVRFYHNLHFYFTALPFLFADPGLNYEVLSPRPLQEKMYDVLRITFRPGVGDASNDEYLLYLDQQTHRMTLLLYTVTYFDQQANQQYSARWYHDWQEVNGLLLPEAITSYRWNDGQLGEKRGTVTYRNVQLDEVPADDSLFLVPTEALVVD